MHRVLMAGSVILDYGVATRTVSAHLFNAVVVRDRHCRFPGCDRPASWADVHHVVHAEDGAPPARGTACCCAGATTPRLHRKGWSAELRADATLVVEDPDGQVFTSHPPGNRPRPPPELFGATG
jgi:hypothetical protein